MARQLEDRIAQIDGAKRHLPARSFGQPVDLSKIRSNLTRSSLIARDSAELAHFVGLDAGIRHSIDQQQEARAKTENNPFRSAPRNSEPKTKLVLNAVHTTSAMGGTRLREGCSDA